MMARSTRILLVDDDPAGRVIVKRALSQGLGDVAIVEADSRASLLTALGAGVHDVIITDYMLPGLNGLDVIDLVRDRGLGTPIIMLTGTGTEKVAVEALKRGVADYVIKTGRHVQRLPFTVQHVLQSAETVCAKQRAEEALRESEERFRSLFENSLIGMYRTTPDGRILTANPALVRMLGYSSFDELARRNLEQHGYAPEYPRSDFTRQIEEEGVIIGLEAAWAKSDGGTLFVRESAWAVRDEAGKALYYEGTVEDITERKRTEERLWTSFSLRSDAAGRGRMRLSRRLPATASSLFIAARTAA